MKRRVFFGLGSNIGDRAAEIRRAVHSLPDVEAVSAVYETDPVGGPEQADFLNCVVMCSSELTPRELLTRAQQAEAEANRERTVENGPRTLDVDLLWIDGESMAEPDLEVPHPRMGERRFVLQPLLELAPDLVDPRQLATAVGEVRLLGPLERLA